MWLLLGLLVLFVGLIYISVSGHDEKDLVTSRIENVDDLEEIDFRNHDSVLVAASTFYSGNVLKQAMQGENYRQAWATPIEVPVVYLDTLMGGMRIVKEGGGKQTHSLRLQAPDGVMYSLRSVNKDPSPLIPEFARTLGIENIITDGISASHPYGAVLAASLAEAAGILHTHPRLVFIPKQEFLGKYNTKYGNRLFLLEYETEGEVNWTSMKNVLEIMDTDELQELKLELGNKLSINKNALVRVRLFDLLIGDWDRHAKQWGWLVQKSGEEFVATPLPGDRDNAFFKIGGVIPTIITDENVQPMVRSFEEEIDYMPGLVYPFDVYFLQGTRESVFVEEARELQELLTNEVIDKALEVWPKAVRDLNGEEIKNKFIHRRENLVTHAKAFHKAIEEKPLLSEPLKGSEDLEPDEGLLKCFECISR